MDQNKIFVESDEDLGLMYKSYKPQLGIIMSFLDTIEPFCNDIKDRPKEVDIDLSDKISKFKKDIDVKFTRSEIDISDIKGHIKDVKKFNDDLDKLLNRFTRLKDKIALSGDFFRGVIFRPKAYSDGDIDPVQHERINKNIRDVNRAMDWVEKAILDLYNAADQDLNVLTIVNKIYAKTAIYEDTLNSLLSTASTTDKKTGEPPGYLSKNHDMINDDIFDDDSRPKRKAILGDEDDEEDLSNSELYKRPSASAGNSSGSGTSPLSSNINDIEDDSSGDTTTDQKAKGYSYNNYYYYTYNNSNNTHHKNIHDDHSVHNNHDDHSYYKRIRSDNNELVDDRKKDVSENFKLDIFGHNSVYTEKNDKVNYDEPPEPDSPALTTILQDVDRKTTVAQQGVKKAVQGVEQFGKAAAKPVVRTTKWVGKIIKSWKDKDETKLKEQLADPHARNPYFHAIGQAIQYGSLFKAGLLMNPLFMLLAFISKKEEKKRNFRLRNEIISELKNEIKIVESKIEDADRLGKRKEKYQLMRFKNELEKKLVRVGGPKGADKLI